jgi:hypothetical protein
MLVSLRGNDGHQIVCAIAYKLLSVSDQQEVDCLVHSIGRPIVAGFSSSRRHARFRISRGQACSHDEAVVQRWHHFAQFNNWHFLNLLRSERRRRSRLRRRLRASASSST